MGRMTPRERMRAALLREEYDRPPLDLGTTPNTTITRVAYERLLRHMGLKLDQEPKIISMAFQLVEVDEAVLDCLHIDTRPLFTNPSDNPQEEVLPGGRLKDAWGIVYQPVAPQDTVLYYDMVEHPLSHVTSAREIEEYPGPDVEDPSIYTGLRERADRLAKQRHFAIVGHCGDTSIFESAWRLRGFQRFLMDLVINKELAHALLERVFEIQLSRMTRYLAEVGPYLDVVCVGDDLAHQTGLLMSPELYREMIKPYHRRYFTFIKDHTPAKLHLHSCGSIYSLLEDLIEVGVDIINPVQIRAENMEPQGLKDRFGDRLVFWGGIDTQTLLPRGTPDMVREEVRRIAKTLGRQGGYVLGAVHNIQADVPPENILAMFDEAHRLGSI